MSQQVLMQGWYWDYPKTANGHSWADTLRLKAGSLKAAGINHIWFPPHAVANYGNASNGYDPQDLFIGNQTTGLGTRPNLNAMLTAFTSQGIIPVADLIFNHRDGGKPELNTPVKRYITETFNPSKQPYPSDRFRCALLLGGTSGNGAGDYYIKIASKTQDSRFFNMNYRLYIRTKFLGVAHPDTLRESEPNGGNDCGNGFNIIPLRRNMLAKIDALGCKTDEFKLTLTSADFDAAGDTLIISLNNAGNVYSDHRIYGIFSSARNKDIVADMMYQTFTDFTQMPSGRGMMNHEFFKPNSANVSSTFLDGDWDRMDFFYDYDQSQKRLKDSLINYTKWNWTELGVRGLRMDAVKHFDPVFISDMLDSLHKSGMDPGLVVGEWYSSNTAELKGWLETVTANMEPSTKAAISPRIFDFALRESLRKACDDRGFDVRRVFNESLHDAAQVSGFNILTFINNHDFRDSTGFASLIKHNPILAYAYIITNNQLGLPTIFYPDYYGYPLPNDSMYKYHPIGLPVLQNEINTLLQVLKKYINGSPGIDYLNRLNTPFSGKFLSGSTDKALIYQIQGFAGNQNKEVIMALNFSTSSLKCDQQINNRGGTIKTSTRFTEISGNSPFPYALVDEGRQVYLEVPPKSYGIWIQGTMPVITGTSKAKNPEIIYNAF